MTTFTISLPPETEAKLRERAAAAGKDPTSFALEALQEKLAVLDDDKVINGQNELPKDQWIARLRQWAASHRRLSYEADDSRESIYEGRGERESSSTRTSWPA